MSAQWEEIGNRLRAYRLGKNFTASDMAERIGVSRAALYRLEKGELVKIETLEKLADLLEISLPSRFCFFQMNMSDTYAPCCWSRGARQVPITPIFPSTWIGFWKS